MDLAGAGAPGYQLAGSLALSRATLDRAAERRRDETFLHAAWADPRSRVLLVGSGQTLLEDGQLMLLRPEQAPAGDRYLLAVDAEGGAWFAVHVPGLDDPRAADLRLVGAVLDDRETGLVVHAVALANWHETHPRCSRCGAPTTVAAAGHVRHCAVDNSDHFPRTDPAVIVLVVDDENRALLGRQERWPPRRFSTLAGFVEPGESLERAVAREVREETGIELGEVSYAGSQPWPFPSSLMLGFYARATSTQIEVDGEEIAEARWFDRSELAAALASGGVILPPPVSIARRLVEGWYGGPLPGEGAWR